VLAGMSSINTRSGRNPSHGKRSPYHGRAPIASKVNGTTNGKRS
jgi:hypothetical protein